MRTWSLKICPMERNSQGNVSQSLATRVECESDKPSATFMASFGVHADLPSLG